MTGTRPKGFAAMTMTTSESGSGSSIGAGQEPGRVHTFDAGELSCATGLAEEFRRQIQQIPLGDELLVTTGDPSAKKDLPPLARMMGHTVRSIETSRDGSLVIDVERRR
jgi:TusA-related sulfurtransferase